MLFFSWFAWMPERIGQFVYLLVSLSILFLGTRAFLQALLTSLGWDFWKSRYRNWVCLLVSSELIGSILTTKLELLMVGVTLYAFSLLLTGRRPLLAGLCMGLLLNWKFQPLPIIGLVTLGLGFINRKTAIRFALGVVAVVILLMPLPFPFQSWDATIKIHSAWKESLSAFIERDWLAFHHLFTFLNHGLGIEVPYRIAQGISAGAGLALAAGLAVWLQGVPRADKARLQKILLIALTMGCGFIVCLSPLSQSNAYIWYAPMVLVFAWAAERTGARPGWVGLVLGMTFILVSILYSDLCPRPLYKLVFAKGIKPVGALFLLLSTLSLLKRLRSSDVG